MKSVRKVNKPGKRQNEIIISDDIDTTESYAGIAQQNLDTCGIVNLDFNYTAADLRSKVKARVCEQNFLGDLKVSPEADFNLPMKPVSRNPSRKSIVRDKNIKPSSAKSSKIKSSDNVTSLPILNLKKSMTERDQSDVKSKSINDQIEKIENRKQNLSISEKKSRMKEVMKKGKQNWSNFKADIDFIKSVETNNIIVPNESASIIKDEKVLNSILNELSCLETENSVGILLTQNDESKEADVEISTLADVDNQENILEFKSLLKPMLKTYISHPIVDDVAMSLKNIIFNSTSRSWGVEWYRQNFEFHPIESELSFAMIQRTDGPNCVMCVVQAEFLIEALFHSDVAINWICNVRRNRNKLLAFTLTRIISRCRKSKTDTMHICLLDVKLKGRIFGTVKPDGITECLVVYQMSTKEDAQDFILHHISQFTDKLSPGLILLVVSCLLTHGMSQCIQELKTDDTRLVSPLGYPREELMNLLLIGKITSHYFNDIAQIVDDSGSYRSLSGIPTRSSVGFLTTELHCQHCKEIGTYLKTPKYPVWLAKLEHNEYTVLYCLNGNLINDWKTEIKFQLNLYSPLYAKKGILKMTIDSSFTQSEKIRLGEEDKRLEKEKERRNREVTDKRIKKMSNDALRFVLDDESVEEYLNDDNPMGPSSDQMNSLEKIIYIKWPNANVSLTDEQTNILSFFKN